MWGRGKLEPGVTYAVFSCALTETDTTLVLSRANVIPYLSHIYFIEIFPRNVPVSNETSMSLIRTTCVESTGSDSEREEGGRSYS